MKIMMMPESTDISITNRCNSRRKYCGNITSSSDVDDKRARRMQLFYNVCDLAKAVFSLKFRISHTGWFWENKEGVFNRIPEADNMSLIVV